ncbi:MAG: hypothetical protein EOO13_10715 [Chitinophagaceae bacterium]|nr:MAG: hypothetical protein EOO13_10715 [Chitinophagaceae bacterium]
MSFQSLYNDTFNDSTQLEKIAREYPYFSLSHFFRFQKADTASPDYHDLAAKAALHFANPYLLNQQLQQANTIEAERASDFINEPAIVLPETEKGNVEENFNHRVEVMEETVDKTEPETIIPITVEAPPAEIATKEAIIAENLIEENNPPLLFEPLHTTDYFASQGIKLSEVVQPGDKMGRQLKSFTEWLKTMKKVHPDGLKDKPLADGSIDPSVQKLAEKSNKEEEVLTESMAEVYLQQGKTNKAKGIYEKLSLLNPSKNAYFAAKLNEIQ